MFSLLWIACALLWFYLLWQRPLQRQPLDTIQRCRDLTITQPQLVWPDYGHEAGFYRLDIECDSLVQFALQPSKALSNTRRWFTAFTALPEPLAHWCLLAAPYSAQQLQFDRLYRQTDVKQGLIALLGLTHPHQPTQRLLEGVRAHQGVLSVFLAEPLPFIQIKALQHQLKQLATALAPAPTPTQPVALSFQAKRWWLGQLAAALVIGVSYQFIVPFQASFKASDLWTYHYLALGLPLYLLLVAVGSLWLFRRMIWQAKRILLIAFCLLPSYLVVGQLALYEADLLSASPATSQRWYVLTRYEHYTLQTGRNPLRKFTFSAPYSNSYYQLTDQQLALREPNGPGVVDVHADQLELAFTPANTSIQVQVRRGGISKQPIICQIGPTDAVSRRIGVYGCG